MEFRTATRLVHNACKAVVLRFCAYAHSLSHTTQAKAITDWTIKLLAA